MYSGRSKNLKGFILLGMNVCINHFPGLGTGWYNQTKVNGGPIMKLSFCYVCKFTVYTHVLHVTCNYVFTFQKHKVHCGLLNAIDAQSYLLLFLEFSDSMYTKDIYACMASY